jgi:hypothetical protein
MMFIDVFLLCILCATLCVLFAIPLVYFLHNRNIEFDFSFKRQLHMFIGGIVLWPVQLPIVILMNLVVFIFLMVEKDS